MTVTKSKPTGAGLLGVYGVALAVCGGLTAAAYLFGVEPVRAEHAAYAVDEFELETRRQDASNLGRTLATTQRKLDETRAAVAATPLRLEPATAVNARIARLAELAAGSGLSVDEMQPAAPQDATHCQTVVIRIAGSGTYPATAAFLHRLRERFPDTGVRSFDLSNANPTPDHPAGTFRAELIWYAAPVKK